MKRSYCLLLMFFTNLSDGNTILRLVDITPLVDDVEALVHAVIGLPPAKGLLGRVS